MLVTAVANLSSRSGLRPFGPLISEDQRAIAEGYVASARADGARLHFSELKTVFIATD